MIVKIYFSELYNTLFFMNAMLISHFYTVLIFLTSFVTLTIFFVITSTQYTALKNLKKKVNNY